MFRRRLVGVIRSYFNLSSRERSGLLVLSVILFIHLSVLLYQRYVPDDGVLKEIESNVIVTSFIREVQEQEENKSGLLQAENKSDTHALFYFDPNSIDAETWQRLGLSAKQAASIVRYIRGGGRIRHPSDLRKLYVLDDEASARLEPYVRLIDDPDPPGNKKAELICTLDLNTADSTEMLQLKGVGPGRARMICRYRDALGGFVNVEQLKEVYTIDSSVYQQLLPQIKIQSQVIKRMAVNTDTLRHPYISRKAASMLVSYRMQHGPYHAVADLLKSRAVDSVTAKRLAPYLTFE